MSGRSRVCLSLEDRVKVIEERDKGVSERKLAKMFKCGKTQINGIIKTRNAVMNEWQRNMSPGVKRKRKERFSDINTAVFEWLKIVRDKGIPINGCIIKEKALQIAFNEGVEDFSASNGWLERFRVRHNIVFRTIDCEASGNTLDDWKSRLPSIIQSFSQKNIYSMSESGLLFRTLPSKAFSLYAKLCKGGKLANERLTVALCVSGDGEKEPPLVIGKALLPEYLKNKGISTLGASLHTNEKAWMTSEIFENWVKEFDRKMGSQNRNVILFLNNAPCHMDQLNLSNVTVHILPSSSSEKFQPLDQGVIQTFKLNYRKMFLKYIIARMNETSSASKLAKKVTVSDVISWITLAWKDIQPGLIVKCFQSCGFLESNREDIDFKMEKDSIRHLFHLAGITYDQAALEEENHINCYDDFSGGWEESLTQDSTGDCIGDDNENEDSLESDQKLNPQDILCLIDKCHEAQLSSECYSDKINQLFIDLKGEFERKIIEQKCTTLK